MNDMKAKASLSDPENPTSVDDPPKQPQVYPPPTTEAQWSQYLDSYAHEQRISKRELLQTLADQHGFHPSLAQLEAQLRRRRFQQKRTPVTSTIDGIRSADSAYYSMGGNSSKSDFEPRTPVGTEFGPRRHSTISPSLDTIGEIDRYQLVPTNSLARVQAVQYLSGISNSSSVIPDMIGTNCPPVSGMLFENPPWAPSLFQSSISGTAANFLETAERIRHPAHSLLSLQTMSIDENSESQAEDHTYRGDRAASDGLVEHDQSNAKVDVIIDDGSPVALWQETFIFQFAERLSIVLEARELSTSVLAELADELIDLLRNFAMRLGQQLGTVREHTQDRAAMLFMLKNRFLISSTFREINRNASDEPSANLSQISLSERVNAWYSSLQAFNDDLGVMFESEQIKSRDLHAAYSLNVSKLSPGPEFHLEYLFSHQAYKWLLWTVRKRFFLALPEDNVMEEVESIVLMSLPLGSEVRDPSFHPSSDAIIEVEWNPARFVEEQLLGGDTFTSIGSIITITGTSSEAQALTCYQYMRQTWPISGIYMIQLIDTVLASRQVQQIMLPDGAHMTASMTEKLFIVKIRATSDVIAEAAAQLSWLGSSLRSSIYEKNLVSCFPTIREGQFQAAQDPSTVTSFSSESNIVFRITFSMMKNTGAEHTSDSLCWLRIFKSPVLVPGFPIRKRTAAVSGLEIPLNIAAALVATRFVNKYRDTLVIKGFSAMIVPTFSIDDILRWHVLANDDGEYIGYDESTSIRLVETHFDQISRLRHILGWTSKAEHLTGASGCPVVKPSRLNPTRPGFALDKFSLSFGKVVTGNVGCTILKRDQSIHLSRGSYVSKLRPLSEMFVLLWDVEAKRGWLVNGVNALLHLVRSSLQIDATGDFSEIFEMNWNAFEESSAPHSSKAAFDVLSNKTNLRLKIAPSKFSLAIRNEEPNESTEYETFADRVEQFCSGIEMIASYQKDAENQDGISGKPRIRKHLEGWDFVALAKQSADISPCHITLPTISNSWVDLLRSINTVTLFGKGFGELIKPIQGTCCPQWTELRPYLVACSVADLNKIIDKHGDPDEKPILLSRKASLSLNCPHVPFAVCRKSRSHEACDPVLVPLPSSWNNRVDSSTFDRPLTTLRSDAAIMLGYSKSLSWFYKALGLPVQGTPPDPVQELQAQLNTLEMGNVDDRQNFYPTPDSTQSGSTNIPPTVEAIGTKRKEPEDNIGEESSGLNKPKRKNHSAGRSYKISNDK